MQPLGVVGLREQLGVALEQSDRGDASVVIVDGGDGRNTEVLVLQRVDDFVREEILRRHSGVARPFRNLLAKDNGLGELIVEPEVGARCALATAACPVLRAHLLVGLRGEDGVERRVVDDARCDRALLCEPAKARDVLDHRPSLGHHAVGAG